MTFHGAAYLQPLGKVSISEKNIVSRYENLTRTSTFSFWILVVYTVSFLLHVPSRIPAIAPIRLDLILLTLLAFSLISNDWDRILTTKSGRLLLILMAWVLLTIPFVEWPGSVLRENWKPFLKATIFFFAIVLSVSNKRQLAIFLCVFLLCQVFRMLEPLYLHLTDGYWGSRAYMSGGSEFMDRLSGAPADVINPNGLAFVVIIILPFLHCLMGRSKSHLMKLGYLVLLLISLYVLMLTGSRSGLIGVAIVLAGLLLTSHRKILFGLILVVLVVGMSLRLDINQRDRYLSIVSSETQNAATASGRIKGWWSEATVAIKNPSFGNGIGTSREALYNAKNSNQVSHNLYIESVIELGVPGAIIFLLFLYSSWNTLVKRNLKNKSSRRQIIAGMPEHWLVRLNTALMISFFAWAVFSLAQYGLTEYHWYILCGLVTATSLLQENMKSNRQMASDETVEDMSK